MHLVDVHTQGFGCKNFYRIGMGEPDCGLAGTLVTNFVNEVEHAIKDLADGFTARKAEVAGLGHEFAPGRLAIQLGECGSRPFTEVTFDEAFIDDEWPIEPLGERFGCLTGAFEW